MGDRIYPKNFLNPLKGQKFTTTINNPKNAKDGLTPEKLDEMMKLFQAQHVRKSAAEVERAWREAMERSLSDPYIKQDLKYLASRIDSLEANMLRILELLESIDKMLEIKKED